MCKKYILQIYMKSNNFVVNLGIVITIITIIYIILITQPGYINKNSLKWEKASNDQKVFVGYTNMLGASLGICIFIFDQIMFDYPNNYLIYIYILKLIILITFISFSYYISSDNDGFSIFVSGLQPLQGFLQMLCVVTTVQLVKKFESDQKLEGWTPVDVIPIGHSE